MAECGDVILPEAIAILNPDSVECPAHGWVSILRNATLAETAEQVYGIQIQLDISDEPPF